MMDITQKLTEIISHGLVKGLGNPVPGELCLGAAICLAYGEPHSARPSCVAEEDLAWCTTINDAPWSSVAARAKALLPLGLAMLGTAGTDRGPWVRAVVLDTIRRVMPLALDYAVLTERAAEYRTAPIGGTVYASFLKPCSTTTIAAAAEAATITVFYAASYTLTANNGASEAVLLEAVAVALDAYRETANGLNRGSP